MLVKWSTQRAGRVRVCAVLGMPVPHLGIHTLWRFPCAPIYSFLFSVDQKSKCLLVLASPQR